jgi:hypothetical protein
LLRADGYEKTKYMFMSRHQTAGQSNYIRVANKSLEKVAKFKYLDHLQQLHFHISKYFRCYFYGRKFLVKTDHAALTFLHNFAENNSLLMRCSLRLAEFDFTVERTPGSKVAHVDALSRHVGGSRARRKCSKHS